MQSAALRLILSSNRNEMKNKIRHTNVSRTKVGMLPAIATEKL